MKTKFIMDDRIVVLHDDHGAFVFRQGEGMVIYPPKKPRQGPASPEYVTAAMLAWLLCSEEDLVEMHERFRAFCAQQVKLQKSRS